MSTITSETLRDIAVKTVELFLNDKVPLSSGLAKQASAYELNSDQIQRAVEACNSIAYLKVLELSKSDRTVEFPLCKFASVMSEISLPEIAAQGQEKQAQVHAASVSTFDPFSLSTSAGLEKKAGFDEVTVDIQLTPAEAHQLLFKMASENTMLLSQAKVNLARTEDELTKKASLLHKDPLAANKLSYLGVGGMEKFASEKKHGHIFWPEDLVLAQEVIGLQKQANELKSSIVKMEDLEKRAELFKQSFLGALAGMAGKAVGHIATRPFQWGLANPAKRVVKAVKQNIAANSGKPLTEKAKGLAGLAGKVGAGVGTVAMAGFDASMYSPKPSSNVYHQLRNVKPYGG